MAGDSAATTDTGRPDGAAEVDAGTIWNELKAEETGAAAASAKDDTAAAVAAMAEGAADAADLKSADKQIADGAADKAAAEATQTTTTADKDAGADKAAADAQPPAEKPAGADAGKPDDIWAKATLTPEQKAAIEADRARIAELEQLDKTHRGRLSAQDRELAKLRSRPAAPPAAGTDAKPVEKIDPLKLIQDDPDFQQLEKELPEVAGPMGKILVRLADRMQQTIEPMRAHVTTMETERTAAYLEEQDRMVRDVHDDYDDIVKSDEGKAAFIAWYEKAPAYVKAGVERNRDRIVDGNEVADLVSKFKSDTGWKRPASAAASAAASPTADPPPAPPPASTPAPKNAESVRRDLQIRSAEQPKTTSGSQVAAPSSDDPKAIWNELREMERREAASR